MTEYNRVVFNRGTGLGNRLFPWARCVIDSIDTGRPMLAPHWWWPPRRSDPLIGIFRPRPSEIGGLARLRIEAFHQHVRIFEGEADRFAALAGRQDELLHAFRDATRTRWLEEADAAAGATIGMHVRRGDFSVARHASDFQLKGALQTPIEWYVHMLRLVRRIAASNLTAVVASDGSDAELAPLTHEPNVKRVRSRSAATDLLVLSGTRFLLGSGGSSFSAWAAFFGSIPVFTIPGQSLTWFKTEAGGNVVGVCDPAEPPEEFIRCVLTLKS